MFLIAYQMQILLCFEMIFRPHKSFSVFHTVDGLIIKTTKKRAPTLIFPGPDFLYFPGLPLDQTSRPYYQSHPLSFWKKCIER